MSKWLSETEWCQIEQSLPILCVDALPLRYREHLEVGLILRQTPNQGQRWCFVGGRVQLDESLHEALAREWRSAFGASLPSGPNKLSMPHLVEYQRAEAGSGAFDPRKHAVSATYGVLTEGALSPHGDEALAFEWFTPATLDRSVMGFGQETAVLKLLQSPQFARLCS